MGWLAILVGIIGPVLTLVIVDTFLGEGSYSSSLTFQTIGVMIGSLLIYKVGMWLNDPARLEIRREGTDEVLGVRPEHTFCLVPFQFWAFIFPILCFFLQ